MAPHSFLRTDNRAAIAHRPVSAFRSYRAVLRAPSVAWLALGAAIASLPIGGLALAVLLLAQQSGGIARAGVVVAALAVGTGLGIEAQGRLMDIHGQFPVLVGSAVLQLLAITGLVHAAGSGGGVGVLAALAGCAGACEPQVGGALRALWPHLVADRHQHTAAAVSSLLMAVSVTTAPLALALVLAVASPTWAVLGCAACSAAGALIVAASPVSRSWRPPTKNSHSAAPGSCTGVGASRWMGALASPGVRALAAIGAVAGLVTAVVQVCAAGLASDHGSQQRAAWLYAALALGSLLGVLVDGGRRPPRLPAHRSSALLGLTSAGCVLAALCAAAGSVTGLGLTLFAVGTVLAPVTVTCFSAVREHAPAGSGVGAFTALTSTSLVASAAGSVVAGAVLQSHDPSLGYAGVALLSAVAAAASLRKRAGQASSRDLSTY